MDQRQLDQRTVGADRTGDVHQRLRYWAKQMGRADLRQYGSQIQETLIEAADLLDPKKKAP